MSKPDYEPLRHLKCHAHILNDGLLQRIDELSVSDYPAITPNQIIGFLRDFLTELSRVIDKTVSEERLKTLSSLIQGLGIFLEWLDNAHTEQTPRGLVHFLKDIIDHMIPASRVIAYPQAQYNYTICDLESHMETLVNNYIPHSKQENFKKYLSSPIKLISFPRIERDNMLAHAIFGHELGHHIASEYLAEEVNDIDKYQETCRQLQQRVSEFVDKKLEESIVEIVESDRLALTTQLLEDILQIRKRALEELVSDAVGIFIFGPSAFFACFELFLGSNLDAEPTPDEFYPPPRMRIRLMLNLMEEEGFNNKFSQNRKKSVASYLKTTQKFIENAKQLSAAKEDQAEIENNPILKIAYASMEASLPEAYNFAKKKTEKVSFNSGVIFSQLPELVRRLELSIPPNEVGDPRNPQTVDYRATLLASWIFKLRGVSSSSTNSLSNKEINQLHKLTLRAIEYIILQDDYKYHMEDRT